MDSNNEPRQIIKSFCVVGLNEMTIKKYDEESNARYVQNVDIVQKNINGNIEIEGEKWTRILKNNNYWLRVQYSKTYNEPITGFTISECEYESPQFLLEKKENIDKGYKPVIFSVLTDGEYDEFNNKTNIKRECNQIEQYNNYYMKVPSFCNIKDQLKLPFKSEAATLLVTRSTSSVPLKDIQIRSVQGTSSYQFGLVKNKSPYTYKYLPEIIDAYPQDNTINPGIATFCFPEGIKIKTKQDMPKWFSFVLTDQNGRRTYGSVLIFTEDLSKELIHSFVPILTTKETYYVEKAICILSNYPFFHNCKIFLRELYRIQVSSSTNIPLERAICHFVDSLYFQTIDKMLSITIAEEELKFYRIPIYGNEWDTVDESIEVLFSILSYETILTVWEGLLLEKKVFLLCSSKSVLLHVSTALINLLFPFTWMHILVPILPEKLKVFIESPVPLLIGLSYPIDLNELPNDSLILNIEKNTFENYIDKLPKLPPKLYNSLMKSLNKLKAKYNLDNVSTDQMEIKNKMESLDEVFSSIDIDSITKIDCSEIRDAFYEFFIQMFKNYEKYFNWKKKKAEEPLVFLKDVFLKDHSSTETGSFLNTFSETTVFSQFEDSFKYLEANSATSFFLESIKKGKGKSKVYLPRKIPSISTVIPEIKVDDLKGQTYCYKVFPSLDHNLYIQTEVPKPQYQSRFVYMRDEWCYDLPKMSNKDWGKYLMYSNYEIWCTFFAFIIHLYDDKKAFHLMQYAIFIIEDLIHKHKIIPSKNLFTKLIKSCGRSCLTSFVKPLLNLVNTSNQQDNGLFQYAFMNGLYSLTENMTSANSNANPLGNSLINSVKLVNGSIRTSNMDILSLDEIQCTMDKTIFLSYELCPHCLKNKKPQKKISIEEIISGFSRGKSDYASICPTCLSKIFPKLYLLEEDQLTLDTQNVNFLSPIVLMKEVDNLIKNHGEKYFYLEKYHQDKYHRHIFWNIAFYFQLFDLPLCVLYLQNDDDKFNDIVLQLEESKQRRIALSLTSSMKRKNIKANNQSANDARMSTILSETMSKKFSSASNDVQSVSCLSGKNYFSNLGKYEQDLWKGIQAKMEKTSPIIDSEKSVDDRGELNSRIYDIKQIVSKTIENFVQNQKGRLEKVLMNIEYNDNMNQPKLVEMEEEPKCNSTSVKCEKSTISDDKPEKTIEEKGPSTFSVSKNNHFYNTINLKDNNFFVPNQSTKQSVAIKIKLKPSVNVSVSNTSKQMITNSNSNLNNTNNSKGNGNA